MVDISPPTFVERMVVLGPCRGVQVELCSAIHASPLYTKQPLVIWSQTATPDEIVRELDLVSRVIKTIDESRSGGAADDVSKRHYWPLSACLRVACSSPAPVSSVVLLEKFLPAPATDLFVYLAAVNPNQRSSSGQPVLTHGELLVKQLEGAAANGGGGGTCVIICTNETYSSIAASLARDHPHLERWAFVIVRVPFLGPPALTEPHSLPRFHDELVGPIENVCLGVVMGVLRKLPVPAGYSAGVVPVDVAVNVALLLVSVKHNHQLPPAMRERKVIEVGLGTGERSLVWGMVGEYLIDYYGRHRHEISRTMPVDICAKDPSLDFAIHFHDLWNRGMSFTAPMVWYRTYTSRFQKSHLARFPHSAVVERMQTALSNIDSTVERLMNRTVSPSPAAAVTTTTPSSSPPGASAPASRQNRLQEMMATAHRNVILRNSTSAGCNPEEQAAAASATTTPTNSFLSSSTNAGPWRTPLPVEVDTTNYDMLLRLLIRGGSRSLRWLPFVSLDFIPWEMYVKKIAVGVLHYTLRYILDVRETATRFPAPTIGFHNDLIFHGDERVPESNLWLRRAFPDLHWALRCGQQPNGAHLLLRAGGTVQRRLAILAQPHIQLLINQISREEGVSKAAVEQRATSILLGIGDTMNHQQLRTLGYAIKKVFQTLYHRITLNPEAYERLFQIFRTPRTAVVVIPAHRSYVDFLVISYLLVMMGLPVPHICSGEDFLRLGRISELLRGSGAFFMRRSFKTDRLYGALFKEYIRHLVRDGECVEFFVEGMRSRSGKTLPPKLGILKFVTDAFFEKQEEIDDVLFVPVGLSYDKVLEGNVYADELMGIPKPKETVANLVKSSSILRQKFGALNVSVGDPISLKAFADDPHQCPPGFERTPEQERVPIRSTTSSISAGGGTYTPLRVLAALAWRITYELQKNIMVTPTALLATVLQCVLPQGWMQSSGQTGVAVAVVASNVEWLRSAVLHRQGKMDTHFAVCDGAQLMNYAMQLLAPRVWISPLSHLFVNSEMTDTTQMVLSIYTNQLLHVFADEGLLAVATFAFGAASSTTATTAEEASPATTSGAVEHVGERHAARDPDVCIAVGELKDKTRMLRLLLAQEIPNYLKPCPISFDSWFSAALNNLADDARSLRHLPLTDDPSEEIAMVRNQFTTLVSNIIYPFLEAHWIVLVAAAATLSNGMVRLDEAFFMRLVVAAADTLYRTKAVPFLHSSSRETLKNCIQCWVDADLIVHQKTPAPVLVFQRPLRAGNGGDSRLTAENIQRVQEQSGKAPAGSPGAPAPPGSSVPTQLPKTVSDALAMINRLRWRPADADALPKIVSDIAKVQQSLLSDGAVGRANNSQPAKL